MNQHEQHFEEFMRGYLACALWSSNDTKTDPDTDEETVVEGLEDYEWGDGEVEQLTAEARTFFEAQMPNLLMYVSSVTFDASQGTAWDYAGHDFWLTRNSHGAGFWDRDGVDEEVGQHLSDAVGHGTQWPGIDLFLDDSDLVRVNIMPAAYRAAQQPTET